MWCFHAHGLCPTQYIFRLNWFWSDKTLSKIRENFKRRMNINECDIHQFDGCVWLREVGNNDKLIMCLSHFVCLNVSRVHLPKDRWVTQSKNTQSVWGLRGQHDQVSVTEHLFVLTNALNCYHHTSFCLVAAVCLSCFPSSTSPWVWKWQGYMAASPPPTSPSRTLTTST